MKVGKHMCRDYFNGHFCQFIRGHGGPYHGTFTAIKDVWRDSPFKHLWKRFPAKVKVDNLIK